MPEPRHLSICDIANQSNFVMLPPLKMKQPCPFPKIHPSQLLRDDGFFMSLAYNQAIDAWREDEVPVGAVIVMDGEVIASAHNQVMQTCDATAHAEVLAITAASRALGDWRLAGATLYVTKEPCPMCSGAIILSRISRVVFAFGDPKMGGLGGALDVNALKESWHHFDTLSGIMEEECRTLVQSFFELKRNLAKQSSNKELPFPSVQTRPENPTDCS
jgi:tRNA(adenine34) deaminase